MKDGQELVLAVCHALATGPQWEKTLLIIFYDEHGGFFDHASDRELVRHRPAANAGDEGAGSKSAALARAYKLLESAQERWRRFNGHELVGDVLAGVRTAEGH